MLRDDDLVKVESALEEKLHRFGPGYGGQAHVDDEGDEPDSVTITPLHCPCGLLLKPEWKICPRCAVPLPTTATACSDLLSVVVEVGVLSFLVFCVFVYSLAKQSG